jgi:hypothetical protein
MPELGSSGSVRGVASNGHPYRDPGAGAAIGRQRLTLARPLGELDWGDRHYIFNEPSMQVTACPPSQIVSSWNSTATKPSRPTQQ